MNGSAAQQAWWQFWAVARCYYCFDEIPPLDPAAAKRGALDCSAIQRWYGRLRADIVGGRSGYPNGPVRKTPTLEDEVHELVGRSGLSVAVRKHKPALCLSHDIDYLRPTLQLRLKRTIAERRLVRRSTPRTYLASVERLLQMDLEASGSLGNSTVFVASPRRLWTPRARLTQWLIDPSYRTSGRDFKELTKLTERFGCHIGVHGSYLSIAKALLQDERTSLQTAMQRKVFLGRQHWLNLPGSRAQEHVADSGIRIDSTLGWNGTWGFRGGLARPFPICLHEDGLGRCDEKASGHRHLWEVPLLLMDGTLFEENGRDSGKVVDEACKALEEVSRRNGCVAVNWHGRAAASDYGWSAAYEQILTAATAFGFSFVSMPHAVEAVGAPRIEA